MRNVSKSSFFKVNLPLVDSCKIYYVKIVAWTVLQKLTWCHLNFLFFSSAFNRIFLKSFLSGLSKFFVLDVQNSCMLILCLQLILNAKCHAIRDAQILEKKTVREELESEDKRLDTMMEIDRINAIKAQEEIEDLRKQQRYA